MTETALDLPFLHQRRGPRIDTVGVSPSDERLCEYCAQVPTSSEELYQSRDVWNLGPWSRIEASHCPLCRLVRLLIYEDSRTTRTLCDADFSRDLSLSWLGGTGPGKRGLFRLNLGTGLHISFGAQAGDMFETDGERYLVPTIEPQIDVSRVEHWLDACGRAHRGDCVWTYDTAFEDAFPHLRVLRCVDVFEDRLVELDRFVRYAALSYVWGVADNFQLTTANKDRLLGPGGIRSAYAGIPRTIRDAISLLKKLGIRYLWVDALCLLQNDAEDLRRGVQVMDQVYQRAYLVIVAAEGHDADAGLPGVERYTRRGSSRVVEIRPGTSLGIYTNLDQLLQNAVYNSIGWTFQEHTLARRALYFIDNQMFFRCASDDFAEACVDHSSPEAPLALGLSEVIEPPANLQFPLLNYATLLERYSRRALTYQSDALLAMEGIRRQVAERASCTFCQGLPSTAIDLFLLFRADPGKSLHRRAGFPSYSWAGWRGAVNFHTGSFDEADVRYWLAEKTWVIWYTRSPGNHAVELITPGRAALAPGAGGSAPARRPQNDALLRGIVRGRLRTTSTEPTGLRPYKKSENKMNLRLWAATEIISGKLPYALLAFWTVSVSYRLDKVDVFAGTCTLVGKNGNACGSMALDGLAESTFFASNEPYEVILLSERNEPEEVEGPLAEHESWIRRGPKVYFLNAMLLERNKGIAERRGIGKVDPEELENSILQRPRWKEIVLG